MVQSTKRITEWRQWHALLCSSVLIDTRLVYISSFNSNIWFLFITSTSPRALCSPQKRRRSWRLTLPGTAMGRGARMIGVRRRIRYRRHFMSFVQRDARRSVPFSSLAIASASCFGFVGSRSRVDSAEPSKKLRTQSSLRQPSCRRAKTAACPRYATWYSDPVSPVKPVTQSYDCDTPLERPSQSPREWVYYSSLLSIGFRLSCFFFLV